MSHGARLSLAAAVLKQDIFEQQEKQQRYYLKH